MFISIVYHLSKRSSFVCMTETTSKLNSKKADFGETFETQKQVTTGLSKETLASLSATVLVSVPMHRDAHPPCIPVMKKRYGLIVRARDKAALVATVS